jgi:hypothetical protein
VLMQTSSQIFKVRTHITFNIIYISAHQWIWYWASSVQSALLKPVFLI